MSRRARRNFTTRGTAKIVHAIRRASERAPIGFDEINYRKRNGIGCRVVGYLSQYLAVWEFKEGGVRFYGLWSYRDKNWRTFYTEESFKERTAHKLRTTRKAGK